MKKIRILTLVLAVVMLIMPCFNTTSMANSPEENYWDMDKNNTELVANCRMIQVADNMSVFMCTLSSNPRVTQNMTSDFSEPLKNVTMEVSVEKPSTKIRNVFIEAKDESGNKDVSNVFLSNNLSGYKIKEIDYASKHLKFIVDKFGKASSKCILPFVNSKDELDYNNDRISYLTIYYNDELKEETKYHITLKVGNTVILDEDRVAPIVQLSIPEKSQVINAVKTTYGNPKDTIPGTIKAKVEDPYNLKKIKQKPAETTKVEEKTDENKKTAVITIGSKTIKKGAENIEMDVAPYIKKGRTMLPIRYVAEALGMKVTWVKETRTVFIEDDTYKVEIPVDTKNIVVNGETTESDVMPELVSGRTMLPIGNVARALGLEDGKGIIWNNDTKEVTIIR